MVALINKRCWIGVVSAVGLLAASSASAASCSSLRSEDRNIDARATSMMGENPGSTLVFGGCLGAAMGDYNSTGSDQDAVKTLVACAAIGCGLTGDYGNCISVDTNLFFLALRSSQIEAILRRGDCY